VAGRLQRRILVFALLFASFSLAFSSVAYYALSKAPSQQFIALGIFSNGGTLSNYFSGEGVNVTVGEILNWNVRVSNQMGSIQYVEVVYRLGNRTLANPGSDSPASSLPQLGNSSIFIPNAQTASLNFTWSISSTATVGPMMFLNMTVNGEHFSPSIGAVGGQRFRLFFELWTFDVASNSFGYGYKGEGSSLGPWLQVWFNA
jgi:hypothetical protein